MPSALGIRQAWYLPQVKGRKLPSLGCFQSWERKSSCLGSWGSRANGLLLGIIVRAKSEAIPCRTWCARSRSCKMKGIVAASA